MPTRSRAARFSGLHNRRHARRGAPQGTSRQGAGGQYPVRLHRRRAGAAGGPGLRACPRAGEGRRQVLRLRQICGKRARRTRTPGERPAVRPAQAFWSCSTSRPGPATRRRRSGSIEWARRFPPALFDELTGPMTSRYGAPDPRRDHSGPDPEGAQRNVKFQRWPSGPYTIMLQEQTDELASGAIVFSRQRRTPGDRASDQGRRTLLARRCSRRGARPAAAQSESLRDPGPARTTGSMWSTPLPKLGNARRNCSPRLRRERPHHPVGDRVRESGPSSSRGDQPGARERLVGAHVELDRKQLAHSRFDRLRQTACNDDERL